MVVLDMARYVFHVLADLYDSKRVTKDQYRDGIERQIQLHGEHDQGLQQRLEHLRIAYAENDDEERVITTDEYFGGLEGLAVMYL